MSFYSGQGNWDKTCSLGPDGLDQESEPQQGILGKSQDGSLSGGVSISQWCSVFPAPPDMFCITTFQTSETGPKSETSNIVRTHILVCHDFVVSIWSRMIVVGRKS